MWCEHANIAISYRLSHLSCPAVYVDLTYFSSDFQREQIVTEDTSKAIQSRTNSNHIHQAATKTMNKEATPSSAAPGAGAPGGHRRSSSGISDEVATSAHEFMSGTIRRSSTGVTDDAARLAREFVRNAKGTGPGLSDDLAEKAHKFMDGPATHRESHSKYLPDVTLPGVTDEIVEEALEFVDGVEKAAAK